MSHEPKDVQELLEDYLELIKQGAIPGDKAVIIFLDDSGDGYNTVSGAFGLTFSEVVALYEFEKHYLLQEMTNPPERSMH